MDQSVVKRRTINLGIKTGLQLRYMKLIVFVILVIMLVVGITFYGTFRLAFDTAQLGRYAEARVEVIFGRLNGLLAAEAFVFVLIAAFFSLKLTHRIAGPMMRIEKRLRDMSDRGVLEEIKIRKDDELHELVDEINNLIRRLAKQQE